MRDEQQEQRTELGGDGAAALHRGVRGVEGYLRARSGVIPCIRITQNKVRFVPEHVEKALGLPLGIIRPQIPGQEIHPLDRRPEWRRR